jgi:glycosyltransferase involved in cell wall biosynthesis
MNTSSTKVKVLFVDHTPFAGGAQLVLADHIEELDKARYEPHVACTDAVPQLIARYREVGAQVHLVQMPRLRRNPLSIFALLGASISLRHLIRDLHIDMVVSNTTRASYVSTIAVLRTRVKLIWWVRDYLYPRMLFACLRRRTSRIICVSHSIKIAYMASEDPLGVVVYVANNLYKQLPAISTETVAQERKRWGLLSGDVVIGFMGRLVAEKGAEDIVKAIGILRKNFPQAKALIVGTGKNQMHDVEAYLHQLVVKEELQDRVIFAGFQSHEALYYSLFDVFVLSTRDGEPFATSVVQAMMAGKPVVGSNCGGTPELVVDGETGLLFTPGSPESLADALCRLLEEPKLRQTVASNGQARVLQYHREEVVTDQVEAIYSEVMQ